MKATMLYGPYDTRFEERPDPTIVQPTDAIIRISATRVCGSDLWPYRGIQPIDQVVEGYRAMDERRAIKTLLQP